MLALLVVMVNNIFMAGAQHGVTFALKINIFKKQKRAPGGRATAIARLKRLRRVFC